KRSFGLLYRISGLLVAFEPELESRWIQHAIDAVHAEEYERAKEVLRPLVFRDSPEPRACVEYANAVFQQRVRNFKADAGRVENGQFDDLAPRIEELRQTALRLEAVLPRTTRRPGKYESANLERPRFFYIHAQILRMLSMVYLSAYRASNNPAAGSAVFPDSVPSRQTALWTLRYGRNALEASLKALRVDAANSDARGIFDAVLKNLITALNEMAAGKIEEDVMADMAVELRRIEALTRDSIERRLIRTADSDMELYTKVGNAAAGILARIRGLGLVHDLLAESAREAADVGMSDKDFGTAAITIFLTQASQHPDINPNDMEEAARRTWARWGLDGKDAAILWSLAQEDTPPSAADLAELGIGLSAEEITDRCASGRYAPFGVGSLAEAEPEPGSAGVQEVAPEPLYSAAEMSRFLADGREAGEIPALRQSAEELVLFLRGFAATGWAETNLESTIEPLLGAITRAESLRREFEAIGKVVSEASGSDDASVALTRARAVREGPDGYLAIVQDARTRFKKLEDHKARMLENARRLVRAESAKTQALLQNYGPNEYLNALAEEFRQAADAVDMHLGRWDAAAAAKAMGRFRDVSERAAQAEMFWERHGEEIRRIGEASRSMPDECAADWSALPEEARRSYREEVIAIETAVVRVRPGGDFESWSQGTLSRMQRVRERSRMAVELVREINRLSRRMRALEHHVRMGSGVAASGLARGSIKTAAQELPESYGQLRQDWQGWVDTSASEGAFGLENSVTLKASWGQTERFYRERMNRILTTSRELHRLRCKAIAKRVKMTSRVLKKLSRWFGEKRLPVNHPSVKRFNQVRGSLDAKYQGVLDAARDRQAAGQKAISDVLEIAADYEAVLETAEFDWSAVRGLRRRIDSVLKEVGFLYNDILKADLLLLEVNARSRILDMIKEQTADAEQGQLLLWNLFCRDYRVNYHLSTSGYLESVSWDVSAPMGLAAMLKYLEEPMTPEVRYEDAREVARATHEIARKTDQKMFEEVLNEDFLAGVDKILDEEILQPFKRWREMGGENDPPVAEILNACLLTLREDLLEFSNPGPAINRNYAEVLSLNLRGTWNANRDYMRIFREIVRLLPDQPEEISKNREWLLGRLGSSDERDQEVLDRGRRILAFFAGKQAGTFEDEALYGDAFQEFARIAQDGRQAQVPVLDGETAGAALKEWRVMSRKLVGTILYLLRSASAVDQEGPLAERLRRRMEESANYWLSEFGTAHTDPSSEARPRKRKKGKSKSPRNGRAPGAPRGSRVAVSAEVSGYLQSLDRKFELAGRSLAIYLEDEPLTVLRFGRESGRTTVEGLAPDSFTLKPAPPRSKIRSASDPDAAQTSALARALYAGKDYDTLWVMADGLTAEPGRVTAEFRASCDALVALKRKAESLGAAVWVGVLEGPVDSELLDYVRSVPELSGAVRALSDMPQDLFVTILAPDTARGVRREFPSDRLSVNVYHAIRAGESGAFRVPDLEKTFMLALFQNALSIELAQSPNAELDGRAASCLALWAEVAPSKVRDYYRKTGTNIRVLTDEVIRAGAEVSLPLLFKTALAEFESLIRRIAETATFA
ncbi:MAG: hypothetical protein HQL11_04375, partial [Candidatus Omnitrophica bacterium]|nr:hypothetical protein [Candidatus Omnitrophota bacterium]